MLGRAVGQVVRVLPEVAPVITGEALQVARQTVVRQTNVTSGVRFFSTTRQALSRRIGGRNALNRTQPFRPELRVRQVNLLQHQVANPAQANVATNYLASISWGTVFSRTLTAAAAVCTAAVAYIYSQQNSDPIINQVVTDKKGNRYLVGHSESLMRDPDTEEVINYYDYIKALVGADAEVQPVKTKYLVLFPVTETESGELVIDYNSPASASQVDVDREHGTENLTYIATHKDYEGCGLGTVLLINAAERCAEKGRDFTGDPIASALSFYAGIFEKIQSVIGGATGDLFDIKSYEGGEDSDHLVVIPVKALKVLVELYKLRESLKVGPKPVRQALAEHPDLIELHGELQTVLGDRGVMLAIQDLVEDRLFSRISDAEANTNAAPAPVDESERTMAP